MKIIIFPLIVGIIFGLIVGIIFGTHAPLWLQGGALVIALLYVNSSYFKNLELGALYPWALIIWFFIGVFIGDISWVFQTEAYKNWEFIRNPFIVK